MFTLQYPSDNQTLQWYIASDSPASRVGLTVLVPHSQKNRGPNCSPDCWLLKLPEDSCLRGSGKDLQHYRFDHGKRELTMVHQKSIYHHTAYLFKNLCVLLFWAQRNPQSSAASSYKSRFKKCPLLSAAIPHGAPTERHQVASGSSSPPHVLSPDPDGSGTKTLLQADGRTAALLGTGPQCGGMINRSSCWFTDLMQLKQFHIEKHKKESRRMWIVTANSYAVIIQCSA